MLHGTIMRHNLGFSITVENCDTIVYPKHTLYEAKRLYRRRFKLIGKKIVWGGNLSCFS